MATKPFTLRLPDEAREDLKCCPGACRAKSYPKASEMLAEKIAAKARRTRAIQEALEESKNCEFNSQEAVEKWVASIGTDDELPLPEPDVFSKPR